MKNIFLRELVTAYLGNLFARPFSQLKPDTSLPHTTSRWHVITKRLFLVTGGNPSMADYLIWPWMERLYLLYGLSKFSVLSAWCAAMTGLPAVKDDSYPVEWHKAFLESYATGNPESQLIGIKEKL